MKYIKVFFFVVFFCALMFSQPDANAAPEPICPGGSAPVAGVVFCENFDNPSMPGSSYPNWEVFDKYCCYQLVQHGNGGVNPSPGSIGNGNVFEWRVTSGTSKSGVVPDTYSSTTPPPTTFVGNQGYNDCCAAWTDRYWVHTGTHYGGHSLGANYSEIHVRWYVYLSPEWCLPGRTFDNRPSGNNLGDPVPCGAKDMHFGRLGEIYVHNDWNGPKVISYENPSNGGPESLTQNQGNFISYLQDQWYLYEIHLKKNTCGSCRDGVVELWIDPVSVGGTPFAGPQTKRLSYANVSIYDSAHFSELFGMISLTANNNVGPCRPGLPGNGFGSVPCFIDGATGQKVLVQPNAYKKWDNIVVMTGNTMIGPMGGGSTPPGPKEPKPPSTFTLTP